MYGCKIGLELHKDLGLPLDEQIRLYKKVGFEGFFAYWAPGMDVMTLKKVADEEGMLFHSLHAPSGTGAYSLWYETERTADVLNSFIACVRDCARAGVPIVVLHTCYDFTLHQPTEFGINNYGKVIEEARRLGVRVALENLEADEYLAALLEYFKDDPNVGLCWDSGHEYCYSAHDVLAEPYHGSKLIATHLNDNLGIRDCGGQIDGRDDLHLLPFDGIIDWQDVAERLARWRFNDILMFELKPKGQPGRHESDAYARMTPEEYVTAAYMRCCRVAALVMRARGRWGTRSA